MNRITCTRVLFILAALVAVSSIGVTTATAQVAPDVTVTRAPGNRMLVEVAEAGVSIRKEIAPEGSLVTITTAKDQLQLRVAGRAMTVLTSGGSAKVMDGTADEVSRLLTLLQQSDAAARGLGLLKRLPVTSRHFGQQALLMTRVILEAGVGQSPSMAITQRWIDAESARIAASRPVRPVVKRVSLADTQLGSTPGECWDKYVAELGRISGDYDECTKDLRWYHALDWAGCTLIFSIRAEAAALWFFNCNGGLPFMI
jgi:hypothetical protein